MLYKFTFVNVITNFIGLSTLIRDCQNVLKMLVSFKMLKCFMVKDFGLLAEIL